LQDEAPPPTSAPPLPQRLLAAARFALGWPLLAAAAAVLAVEILRTVLRAPRVEGDTVQLVLGALRGLRCLGAGAGSCPDLSYFPALQYLPSALLLSAGASPGEAMRGLVWLNLAAWLGTGALLALGLRRARGGWAAALALTAWLGSYGLAYANSSFGEVLTGLLALAFTIGCARAWPWAIVGLLGLLAALGKETAPPFLALLGAAALLPRWVRDVEARRLPWRGPLALLLAAGGGAGVNALFNLWRYGWAYNDFLLQPILRAPGGAQWLSAFGALWGSPNGGLLLFAPLTVAIVLGAGLWALGRAARRQDGGWASAPAIGALAVLVGMTVGLGSWYSPFGWWAWGPRLVLPWLPSCLYLALTAPLPLERPFARVLTGRAGFALVAALLGAAVTLHAAALANPAAYLAHFTDNPACGVVIIQQDPIGFFDYLSCLMWGTDRLLLGRMLRAALEPAALPAVIAAALLQVALLWRTRALLSRPTP
jgi:hypothetical protein